MTPFVLVKQTQQIDYLDPRLVRKMYWASNKEPTQSALVPFGLASFKILVVLVARKRKSKQKKKANKK